MREAFFSKKVRTILVFCLFCFFTGFSVFLIGSPTIQAVTGNPAVPKGAISVDGIFAPPNIQTKSGGTSGNTGVTVGPSTENNGVPFSEVTLSGQQNAVSIWSDAPYRMDFSKSFHGRAYVNFGTVQADGFAFVMQNDSRKTAALTKALSGNDGQNLGVYGDSGSSAFFGVLVSTPEKKAIQNSVSIEFDLYANISGDNMYDADFPKVPHMAYSFPGDLNKGYVSNGSNGNNWTEYGGGVKAKVHHYSPQLLNGIVGDTIQDNTWYEFRYDFDKTSASFTYYLMNPMTGAKTPVTSIPWSDLSSALKLSENNNKAYWGFTGSNGAANGEVKFVFTQVPVDLDAGLKNDVSSGQASIVDPSGNDNYQASLPAAQYGDPVTMRSHFSVMQGEDSLAINDWDTVINPTVFDLTKSVTNVQAIIDNKVMQGTVIEQDAVSGQVKVTFPGLKLPPGKAIDLQYTAQTKATGETQKTMLSSSIHTTELGNNTPRTFPSNPVSFWTHAEAPTQLDWDQSTTNPVKEINVDKSELTQGYQGTFLWNDSDNGEKVQFYLKKGNETIQKLPQVTTNGTPTQQTANFTIPNDKITYGENDLKVEAYHLDKDAKEIKEKNSLTLKLNVSGKLILQSAPSALKWTGRLAGDSKGTLTRDAGNTMALNVLDSREKDHEWSVGVTAETQPQTPFHLVWRQANASDQPITDTPIPVMNASSVSANNYVYSEEWKESEGVLLQSKEYLHVGDYSGKILVHWNLYDTETPE